MKTTADLLGASPQRIDQFIEDAITFQRSLAAITSAHGKPPNIYDRYTRLNITQLQALAPAINWFQFFTEMFPNITSSTEVVVRVPNYMANLSKIVQSTPKRVLNNYMVWHVAQEYMKYMSISFRSVQERFIQAIHGTTQRDVAWRECVKLADEFLGMAFGALFVKKKFPAQSKRQVEYLIAEIKEAFREQLDAQDWMDEITKDAAREKVDAMVDLIGYPDYILNDTLLDKDYEFIDIKEDDFFHNVLSKVNYEYEKARKELHTPVTRHRWAMTPPEINAYYTANQNVIVFPAGMLQWPYFDPTFPRSINYGGIGTVIGHELLHGFDDQGALYDKVGNLHHWWTIDSWLKFQERFSVW
ncbi:endothelin-converting enzyme 2-like [Ptychodera flava]|uniref:endothelin-converting enzyme 2-like n=1 Tax=Ptychodera flava TaxID=63121 RepID=UPI00396A8FEB